MAECARVAARRVLIACPTTATDGSVEFFSDLYRSAVVDPPRMRLPLPDPAEVESWCRRVEGFTVKPWAQVNGLLAELVLVGDLHPQFAVGAAEEYADRRGGWIRALQGARFGDGVLRGFELLRTEPRAPLVDTKRFDASTAAALECVQVPHAAAARDRGRPEVCGVRADPGAGRGGDVGLDGRVGPANCAGEGGGQIRVFAGPTSALRASRIWSLGKPQTYQVTDAAATSGDVPRGHLPLLYNAK